jgi:hypothetical protein
MLCVCVCVCVCVRARARARVRVRVCMCVCLRARVLFPPLSLSPAFEPNGWFLWDWETYYTSGSNLGTIPFNFLHSNMINMAEVWNCEAGVTLAVITLLSYKSLPYSVLEWLVHAAGNTLPRTVKVKHAWSHTSAPSCLYGMVLNETQTWLLPVVNYCNWYEIGWHAGVINVIRQVSLI